MSISAFLLERYDEEEHAAKVCAQQYPTPWEVSDRGHSATLRADEPHFFVITHLEQDMAPGVEWLGDVLAHIARWAPDQVLDDIAAKRAIVKEHADYGGYGESCQTCAESDIDLKAWPCPTLRALAMPYAGHPDFRPEWRS